MNLEVIRIIIGSIIGVIVLGSFILYLITLEIKVNNSKIEDELSLLIEEEIEDYLQKCNVDKENTFRVEKDNNLKELLTRRILNNFMVVKRKV